MGTRKSQDPPRTPRRSARHKHKHISNPGTPQTSRRKHSSPITPYTPHRPIKIKKAHYDTVQRAKVQGVHEWATAHGVPHEEPEIFRFFEVKERAGYDIIQPEAAARTRHNRDLVETRGRKPKLSGADVREADHMLQEDDLGMEAKGMSWIAVKWDLGFEVHWRTLQNIMREALGYGKHKAALEELLPPQTKEARNKWAHDMYAKYPKPWNWHRVRFTDEFHAGYGPEGQLWIIRKRGDAMRYRYDNIQHRNAPPEKNRPRVHAWAATGYNFKEPKLIFYKVPSNSNGAITHKIYHDKILEGPVKKWIERGDDFCLEEDGASGHGGGPKARSDSLVAKWKDKKQIDHYFNSHDSPDLAPIENTFQGPKGHMRKHPHWDEQSLMDILQEGWDNISQKWINELVESMPKRLLDVIRLKGGMTGH